MKKKVVYTLIFLITIPLIYSLIWWGILSQISIEINKQFANQDVKTSLVGSDDDYYIRFSKVVPAGFPFKIGFKIIDWSEESRVGKIECREPIYFGYNLLTRNIYGKYSGDINAFHKPLQSKFGSKVTCSDYSLTVKLPLNLKVLNILRNKERSKFELVNFIKNIELKSGKIKIFDLVNNEELYDQDYTLFKFSFDKRKYYISAQDFIDNMPTKLDIYQTSKINLSPLGRRLLPPNIILGLNLPFTTSGTNKILIKINEPKFEDFAKDLEIYYSAIDSSSVIHKAHGDIIYKGKVENKAGEFYLKIDSVFELKNGFFDKIFEDIRYYTSYVRDKSVKSILRENMSMEWMLSTKLEPLDNTTLRDLEGRVFEFNIDANIVNNMNKVDLKINDISLFSGKTGFRLKSTNQLNEDAKWYFGGLISFNNYPLMIDLIFKRDILGRMNNVPTTSRDIYFETAKNFLKRISDHPNSISNDISFEFSADSGAIDKAKIGDAEVKHFKILYDLELYKEASKRLKLNQINDDELKQLIPETADNKHEIFDQLLKKPVDVGQDMWDKLIK